MGTGEKLGYSEKAGFLARRGLCMALIFLLSGMGGMRAARGEDTTSSDVSAQEREIRSEEIRKALEKAENLKKQKEEKSVPGATSPESSSLRNNAENAVQEKKQPEKGEIPKEKETFGPVQGPGKQGPPSPVKTVSEALPEEKRFEYAALENVNWETSEKKIILRLWISDKATPAIDVTRDEHGMKMRLRPKGLATRMQRTLLAVPPGVQSLSILEEPELAKVWGLEAPYYAVGEIQALFIFPVQYSLHQEPGLLEVTFFLPKKVEPKTIEPTPVPVETIKTMQREALGSPETTLGTSYQSQQQLVDRILYGAQKPPSISDLYKKERENAEFRAEGGLPEDVRPVLEASHPSFGTAEYFKKYIHGSVRQTFDFTTNYNRGVTNAYRENTSDRAEPRRGKNIGTILGTPSLALLFYRPGTFDVSTGYSGSKDFPTTHNNFAYGLNRQNINLGIGHYSDKRYAFTVQNNLYLFGGTTRQKINGKWVKAPLESQQGYQLDNRFGLNYRLSKRLLWGGGAGMSRTRSETETPGGRSRDLLGDMNTDLKYRVTSRLYLLLGTDFTLVFKDTSGTDFSKLTGPSTIITTKGKNLQNVFLSADYRYSKKITLKGTLQESLIDWDIAKFGGSVRITYQRTPHDDLSFQFSSSVIQDNTAKFIARTLGVANRYGLLLERLVTMGLRYNRQFDHGKTRGSLGVMYLKYGPLSGVFYGNSAYDTNINYDILFTASVRRAIFKNRAWLGLLYSYEYAPNKIRNSATWKYNSTSNASQNLIATMDYQF